MIRYFISFFFFLFSFFFETSFFTSLPFPFPLTPFVFAIGVYLLQHQGLIDGFVWIVAFGFLVQLLHMNILPFPALSFLIGGVVSVLSARHVFSNRSLYGVVACALTGFLALIITESSVLVARSLLSSFVPNWSALFVTDGYRIVLLIVVVIILYMLARPIRLLLHH